MKASSLEGAQGTHRGKEGLCFHWGEGDAQKENEGLLLEKGGRGELPLFCFGPRVGAGWLKPPHKRAVAETI